MSLSLEQRFSLLDALLSQHQSLWQQHIFVEPEPRWEQAYPDLRDFLLSLNTTQLEALQGLPNAYQALAEFIPNLQQLPKLCAMPTLEPRKLAPIDRFFNQGIPGRKWSQLQAFAHHCHPNGERYVDWCCGKAHLGRYMQRLDGLPLLGLEYQPSLVAAGLQLAGDADVDLIQADVLALKNAQHLRLQDHILALHACGDLHTQLLRDVAAKGVGAVNLAPCCYQKSAADTYQALSLAGLTSGLSFARADLHTAVQETVTAGTAVQRKRQQLQAWRLGFDCWQRQVSADQQYLPTPSLPQSCLQWGFEGFCRHLAKENNIGIATATDWQVYEQQGWRRFEQTQRLDLARQVFRRAIESWLLLDQALFLQQQGYHVALGEFCRSEVSPRNLMICARRL